MTARATPDHTPVSVTSGSKREASEMRNDPNTSSTPPHPVEEAVARVTNSLTEAALRIVFADGSEWRLVPHDALEALLSALERQKEALEQAAARFRHYEQLRAAKGTPDGDAKAQNNADMAEVCERALSALGGQHE